MSVEHSNQSISNQTRLITMRSQPDCFEVVVVVVVVLNIDVVVRLI